MRLGLLLLIGALALVFVAPTRTMAADLGYSVQVRQAKKPKKVAYADCRVGWWASRCNGLSRPAWGMRCR